MSALVKNGDYHRQHKIVSLLWKEHITRVIQSRQIREVRHVAWAGRNKVFLLNVSPLPTHYAECATG